MGKEYTIIEKLIGRSNIGPEVLLQTLTSEKDIHYCQLMIKFEKMSLKEKMDLLKEISDDDDDEKLLLLTSIMDCLDEDDIPEYRYTLMKHKSLLKKVLVLTDIEIN